MMPKSYLRVVHPFLIIIHQYVSVSRYEIDKKNSKKVMELRVNTHPFHNSIQDTTQSTQMCVFCLFWSITWIFSV